MVQQGTHSELLKTRHGVYWNLVCSQALAGGAADSEIGLQQHSKRQSVIAEKESYETLVESETTAAESISDVEPTQSRSMGVFQSLFLLIIEQRRNWTGYAVMVVAAMGAAGKQKNSVFVDSSLIAV